MRSGGWDQDEVAEMGFFEELLLRLSDVFERKGLRVLKLPAAP
jgi:hypothetical protein